MAMITSGFDELSKSFLIKVSFYPNTLARKKQGLYINIVSEVE
jgi:hypothetical protein